MKILVTGSNGLLGQKLITLLTSQENCQVIASARGQNRLTGDFANFQYESLDVTDAQAVETLLAETRPDAVIHTAAMTNVDECESKQTECRQLNVEAVRYLAESCAKHGIFLLHLSTDFIFDGTAGPYKEDVPASPISFYGQSKADAETVVMEQTGLQWAIARTILVYGIAQDMSRSNIVLWVKKSLEEGKTIQVVDDQWRTPTLAEDLAMGCWLIVKQKAEGIFNISGEELLTPYQMAEQTADYFGLSTATMIRTDSSKFTQPAKRPPRTGFDITKAKTVLGYAPHTFREGIAILAKQVAEQQA